MSKKRFKDGLESIFGNVHEETFDRGLLVGKKENKTTTSTKSNTAAPKKKRSSRKNFTTDLDSLFDGTLSDVVEDKLKEKKSARKNLAGKTKSLEHTQRVRKPLSGLDALIRQTLETGSLSYDPNAKKRITFTCEKAKLEKLRSIARKEKAYLKDILGDIVASFINEYETKKGDVTAHG